VTEGRGRARVHPAPLSAHTHKIEEVDYLFIERPYVENVVTCYSHTQDVAKGEYARW